MADSSHQASVDVNDFRLQARSFQILERANKLFSDGQLLQARGLFTEVLETLTSYHPVAYVNRACVHSQLGYHDLAAGDAYRAVMLLEYVRAVLEGMEEEEDEEETGEAEAETTAEETEEGEAEEGENEETEEDPASALSTHIATSAYTTVTSFLKHSKNLPEKYEIPRPQITEFATSLDKLASYYLINALRQTSSLLDAFEFCESTLQRYPQLLGQDATATPTSDFLGLKNIIMTEMDMKLQRAGTLSPGEDASGNKARSILSSGVARRHNYPWNTHEPDRFSETTLQVLNEKVKLCTIPVTGTQRVEAKVVSLPDLSVVNGGEVGKVTMSQHLGIFAAEDIPVNETFFSEKTCITGWPHPGRQILCDYCATKLDRSQMVHCPECSSSKLHTAYCSQQCLNFALESHHQTLCKKEESFTWIYDDIITSPNPIATYNTILIKTLASSIHRNTHPLDLEEVKYLYGVPHPDRNLTMRWDFLSCVVRPILILTQGFGVDIYSTSGVRRFDTWVLNTLMAKTMGTCSGRFDKDVRPEDSGAEAYYTDDRPDVVSVHPTWSLVNHDCEPNVGWKCDGAATFWGLPPTPDSGNSAIAVNKGAEIKSCYTDPKLDYKLRREWARDMLGGNCMCRRCLREEEGEKKLRIDNLGKVVGELKV